MMIMGAAQVKSLLILASHLSGYPIPADAQPPPIELLSQREMAKDACVDTLLAQLSCPVLGYFQNPTEDGKEHIKVLDAEDYAGHSVNSITVHELTHWLQWHSWANAKSRDCPREFMREYEAYRAGLAYEITYEDKPIPPYFEVPGVDCPTGSIIK